MSELQQLVEHSASRPPDLQIPKAEAIARASADPEHAALYRSILTSIHLTKNRYRSMSPNRFLRGYWILCVTPKTRFAEGRPTKSRRLTRSRESN
jgi:hypothetical protein